MDVDMCKCDEKSEKMCVRIESLTSFYLSVLYYLSYSCSYLIPTSLTSVHEHTRANMHRQSFPATFTHLQICTDLLICLSNVTKEIPEMAPCQSSSHIVKPF